MKMNIAFCVNDAYVSYVTVVIKSILVNTNSPISFYLLCDKISEKSRLLLTEAIEHNTMANCEIILVCDKRIANLRIGKYHQCIWYRTLLPDYLPNNVDRVLYLDADTLVLGELESLFRMDLTGLAVAGGPDILNYSESTFIRLGCSNSGRYICSGVMLINLKYWRDNNVSDKIIKFALDNSDMICYPDQDAINFVCAGIIAFLPLKYAVMDCFLTKYKSAGWFSISELKDCLKEPRIVHFAGNAPWKIEYAHRLFHDDWQKYNMMLKHPVKMKYETKVIPLLKMFLWNLLHRKQEPAVITKEEVLNQLCFLNN